MLKLRSFYIWLPLTVSLQEIEELGAMANAKWETFTSRITALRFKARAL